MGKHKVKPNYRRRLLRLPDLDHCKLPPLPRRVPFAALDRRSNAEREGLRNQRREVTVAQALHERIGSNPAFFVVRSVSKPAKGISARPGNGFRR